ncbi:MAG TPA: biotin/lipoyl-containing protein [Acidimicrobiales bacterium]|nr:biotin/lipoyl-containing protein [Acidimicrobiales bacterium]
MTGPPSAAAVRVGSAGAVPYAARRTTTGLEVTSDAGITRSWLTAVAPDGTVWVGREGDAWPVAPVRRHDPGSLAAAGAGGPVTSPMPGTVIDVHVTVGEHVDAGQPLVTVEAMKMEYAVAAPAAGVVASVLVHAGQAVGLGEALAEVEAEVGP